MDILNFHGLLDKKQTFIRNTWIGGNVNRPGIRIKAITDDYLTKRSLSVNLPASTTAPIRDFKYISGIYMAITNGAIDTTTSAAGTTVPIKTSSEGLQWQEITTGSGRFYSIVDVPDLNGCLVYGNGTTNFFTYNDLVSTPTFVSITAGYTRIPTVFKGCVYTFMNNNSSNAVGKLDYNAKSFITVGIPATIAVTGACVAFNKLFIVGVSANLNGNNNTGYLYSSSDGITFTQVPVYFKRSNININGMGTSINPFSPFGIAFNGEVICIGSENSSPNASNLNNNNFSYYTSTDGLSFQYSGSYSLETDIPMYGTILNNTTQLKIGNIDIANGIAEIATSRIKNNTFTSNGKVIAHLVKVQFNLTDNTGASNAFLTSSALVSSHDNGVSWNISNYRNAENYYNLKADYCIPFCLAPCPNGFMGFLSMYSTTTGLINTVGYLLTDPQAKELCYSI